MVCPYAVNRSTVSQTTFQYDDEGRQTMQETVDRNIATFLPCAQEKCGAWREGRCRYNTDQ